MNNGQLTVDFAKDATVSAIFVNKKNLLRGVQSTKSFYLDWNNGQTQKLNPSHLRVLINSRDRAHIKYVQDIPGVQKLEMHYIMERGLTGIYSYVKLTNTGIQTLTFDHIRAIYRFDPKILTQGNNGRKKGTLPLYSFLNTLPKVQDETWKFSNDTYYSKYDYAGYIRNTPYRGVYGNGYGVWLLAASHEYHSGGPLKQELLLHQDSLLINCMTTTHFGTPSLNAPPGWSKIYGPWLLYFNQGTDNSVNEDAIRQSQVEQSLWPYKWMNDADYPLTRATLTGQITGASRIMVVIHSSLGEEFDKQTLGYLYHAETDKNGFFVISKIRPGNYILTAYPLEGFGIGAVLRKGLEIANTDYPQDMGSLALDVPTNVLWSIGQTNRKSDIYRYSNEERNYAWKELPPSNLEFRVEESNVYDDWYYAQTKKGTWTIRYKDYPDGRSRKLRIGLAASTSSSTGSPALRVSINDYEWNEIICENDASIYRGALNSGNYRAETFIIPAEYVKAGDNFIYLYVRKGSFMYDSINLSVD